MRPKFVVQGFAEAEAAAVKERAEWVESVSLQSVPLELLADTQAAVKGVESVLSAWIAAQVAERAPLGVLE